MIIHRDAPDPEINVHNLVGDITVMPSLYRHLH